MYIEIENKKIQIFHIKNAHYDGKVITCDVIDYDYNTGEMGINTEDTAQIIKALLPHITSIVKLKVLKILDKHCDEIRNNLSNVYNRMLALNVISEIRKDIKKD